MSVIAFVIIVWLVFLFVYPLPVIVLTIIAGIVFGTYLYSSLKKEKEEEKKYQEKYDKYLSGKMKKKEQKEFEKEFAEHNKKEEEKRLNEIRWEQEKKERKQKLVKEKEKNKLAMTIVKTTIVANTSDSKKKASSVAIRGVVGSAVLGPIGAVSGMASAKNKTSNKTTFLIEYGDGSKKIEIVETNSSRFNFLCQYLN